MYNRTPYRKTPPGLRENMRRRQEFITRARRRRARRLALLLAILVVVGLTAAALLGVFSGSDPAAEAFASASASVGAESSTPTLSESASPSIDPKEKEKQAAALVLLINFAHRNTETPGNLIELKDVLGDLVTLNSGVVYADANAAYAAKNMFEAAVKEGITTFVINSAYRTKEAQTELFNNRLKNDPDYGSDPYTNPVKVVPADCSEHCAGLAFDILSVDHNYGSDTFADTTEGKWLAENAYKYGLILRYPEDKQSITGVVYEPWHFRYVGVDVATAVYNSGLCLEEYLESLGLA